MLILPCIKLKNQVKKTALVGAAFCVALSAVSLLLFRGPISILSAFFIPSAILIFLFPATDLFCSGLYLTGSSFPNPIFKKPSKTFVSTSFCNHCPSLLFPDSVFGDSTWGRAIGPDHQSSIFICSLSAIAHPICFLSLYRPGKKYKSSPNTRLRDTGCLPDPGRIIAPW